jgi:hydrogenase maturation factor
MAILDDGFAHVNTGIAIEQIAIELVDVKEGDLVLVHGGVAIGTPR